MNILEVVSRELVNARAKFPPFNSAHEGYAVLLEEVEELKQEVFWGAKNSTPKVHSIKMRAEAIQVAAMALRFIEDCCND